MKQNLLNSVKMTRPNKNQFDLSHDVKLSLNMGELVPIMCMEAVPGDKFNISCESLLRFAPLVSPVMHRFDVTMHYFFVPNRLLWDKWEDFITNTKTAGVLPAFPQMPIPATPNYDRLFDYMGCSEPVNGTPYNVSALPFAAYNKIWNDYYRDQNMQTKVVETVTDGVTNNPVDFTVLRRAWEHDYFTAALPFAQKGDSVEMPLGEIVLKDWDDNTESPNFKDEAMMPDGPGNLNTVFAGGSMGIELAGQGEKLAYDPDGTLVVEPTTINTLRLAFRLQEWLEKMARGGSRMVEVIRSHFGVKSSDKRLQRPEYITGTKSPVVISEVLNTTGTSEQPQGDMAGHAVSVTSGKYGSYRAEEHGYIIGIMSVMPKTAYQQGVEKHFLRTQPTDFFWPSFAHLGEQPILNMELYVDHPQPTETFGYVPRYTEYKYMNNRVAGDFKTTLDFWTLSRIFSAPPALNSGFIECVPDTRIFAVEDPAIDKLYCHVFNKVKAVRPMPKFGTPTF